MAESDDGIRAARPARGLSAAGAGAVLALILARRATSRHVLEQVSGLSRATLAQRLGQLFDAGLIEESDETVPSGGRPARVVTLNTGFGCVLAVDIGESVLRTALLDLAPSVLDDMAVAMDIGSGPANILAEIVRCSRILLARRFPRFAERPVLGLGLSLSAPVGLDTGRVVGPSVMRGWDDFDIQSVIRQDLGLEVFADNDVNLLALMEHRREWPDTGHLLFIKAGTGIGSGLMTDGRLYRGARGVSGDIGHIQFEAPGVSLCRCGKLGCVETRAAGWAIARDLRASGFEDVHNARDVMALLEGGTPEAIQLVREAGRVLGQVTADMVSMLNPAVIVVGGTLAQAGEHVLSGIREFVYRRCLPLAVRDLTITTSRLGADAGLMGAAQFVIDTQLGPEATDRLLAASAA